MVQAVKAEVRIPSASGIPKDAIQNQFFFEGPTLIVDADYDTLAQLLEDFYTVEHSVGDGALVDWWRTGLNGTSWTVRFYTRHATLDKWVIQAERQFTVAFANSGRALPAECCVVMSFHGELTGLQATDQTRRGRSFLGRGWLVDTTSKDSTLVSGNQVYVSQSLQEAIQAAGADLMASADTNSMPWIVWSEKLNSYVPVEGGWVENEWDTQRRRGPSATVRLSWPA